MVRLWNTLTGECEAALGPAAAGLWAVAFSPDGSLLASRSRDGLRFWSTRTWKPVLEPPSRRLDPSMGWRDLAFSPDGGLIAAGTSRGQVWV